MTRGMCHRICACCLGPCIRYGFITLPPCRLPSDLQGFGPADQNTPDSVQRHSKGNAKGTLCLPQVTWMIANRCSGLCEIWDLYSLLRDNKDSIFQN